MDMSHNFPACRHDGWTLERQTRFLDSLAEKGNVRLACRVVNLSPEAAYRLKRRDPLFARAWAAALVLAHDAHSQDLADLATGGFVEEVWFRGELRGTRRRFDTRLFLAHHARLEQAAADEDAQADAARFDELLACLAGEAVPPELQGPDDLPVSRSRAGALSGAASEEAALAEGRGEGGECVEAYNRGFDEGAAVWDGWHHAACRSVDDMCGRHGPTAPFLPGSPLPEPLAAALKAAASPRRSFPNTLSTPSTSALAQSLAASERAFASGKAAPPR